MNLEDYFDVQAPNDIRLKGTRVGIETVLYGFIHRSRRPEEIARSYPSLTLEQVYATITYYLHKKPEIDQYLTDWLEWGDRMGAEQARNPSPTALKLDAARRQRDALRRAGE